MKKYLFLRIRSSQEGKIWYLLLHKQTHTHTAKCDFSDVVDDERKIGLLKINMPDDFTCGVPRTEFSNLIFNAHCQIMCH